MYSFFFYNPQVSKMNGKFHQKFTYKRVSQSSAEKYGYSHRLFTADRCGISKMSLESPKPHPVTIWRANPGFYFWYALWNWTTGTLSSAVTDGTASGFAVKPASKNKNKSRRKKNLRKMAASERRECLFREKTAAWKSEQTLNSSLVVSGTAGGEGRYLCAPFRLAMNRSGGFEPS